MPSCTTSVEKATSIDDAVGRGPRDLTKFAHIPECLITLTRWVLWRRETPPGRDKPTKVPYQPSGRRASSTNPATWSGYAKVLEAYAAGGFAGIGFILGDGFAGVDLDDCIDADGNIEPRALNIIHSLNTYTEISPSGRGIKMLMRGQLPPGRRRKGHVEMYDRGRFFTITGNEMRGAA